MLLGSKNPAAIHFVYGPPCRMTQVPCVVPRGGDHCDFCQTSPVFTVYACSNFTVNGMNVFQFGLTVGSWATCRKCSELVDKEQWSNLSERAYRKFAKKHGVTRHEMLAIRVQCAELSRLFAVHMVKEVLAAKKRYLSCPRARYEGFRPYRADTILRAIGL
jgi:hypothetical protein